MRQSISRACLLLLLGLALSGCAGAGRARARQGSAPTGQVPAQAPLTPGATSTGAGPVEPGAFSIVDFVSTQGGLLDCYSEALRKTKKMGKTVLQFAVLPDGSLAGAQILESTFDDDATKACMMERLSNLKTPFRPSSTKLIRMPVIIN